MQSWIEWSIVEIEKLNTVENNLSIQREWADKIKHKQKNNN